MGLVDFMADAGKKIGGISDLAKEVESTGANIEDLNFEMEGDKVIVSGKALSQEAKEKIILVAGNISGIAQVEENIETEDDVAEADYYTVQSGDSLSKISKTVYGDPMKYNLIFEANQPMLESPDKIYPGQVLRIPLL